MRTNIGKASVLYNNTGRHLAQIRLITTSAEAKRPTLLSIASKDRK